MSIGYYDQIQAGLQPDKTAIEQLWDCYPQLTQTELRNALATFLFYGDEVFRPIRQLSGGERARLLLLNLMLAHNNLLLLDEPTNHLDIASREALEDAMTHYDGTLLVVSHDRYFINKMATRILQLSPEACNSYAGNYDDYLLRRQEAALPEEKPEMPAKENAYRMRKERESQKRRLRTRIARCEEQIAVCEEEIRQCHQQLAQPEIAADYDKVITLSSVLEDKETQLEKLMSDWEETQTEWETRS